MYTFAFDFESRARYYKVYPIAAGAALLKNGVVVETALVRAYRPSMKIDDATAPFWAKEENQKVLTRITVPADDKRSDEELAVDMVVAIIGLRHKGELLAREEKALFYEWQDTTFDVARLDYMITELGPAIIKAFPESIRKGLPMPDGRLQPFRHSTVDGSFGHAHDLSSCLKGIIGGAELPPVEEYYKRWGVVESNWELPPQVGMHDHMPDNDSTLLAWKGFVADAITRQKIPRRRPQQVLSARRVLRSSWTTAAAATAVIGKRQKAESE